MSRKGSRSRSEVPTDDDSSSPSDSLIDEAFRKHALRVPGPPKSEDRSRSGSELSITLSDGAFEAAFQEHVTMRVPNRTRQNEVSSEFGDNLGDSQLEQAFMAQSDRVPGPSMIDQSEEDENEAEEASEKEIQVTTPKKSSKVAPKTQKSPVATSPAYSQSSGGSKSLLRTPVANPKTSPTPSTASKSSRRNETRNDTPTRQAPNGRKPAPETIQNEEEELDYEENAEVEDGDPTAHSTPVAKKTSKPNQTLEQLLVSPIVPSTPSFSKWISSIKKSKPSSQPGPSSPTNRKSIPPQTPQVGSSKPLKRLRTLSDVHESFENSFLKQSKAPDSSDGLSKELIDEIRKKSLKVKRVEQTRTGTPRGHTRRDTRRSIILPITASELLPRPAEYFSLFQLETWLGGREDEQISLASIKIMHRVINSYIRKFLKNLRRGCADEGGNFNFRELELALAKEGLIPERKGVLLAKMASLLNYQQMEIFVKAGINPAATENANPNGFPA